MIVIPDRKVIVVNTPRTGSRSVEQAIREFSGSVSVTISREHHPFPHEVAAAKAGSGYEVWGVIREPLAQLKSWISHCQEWDASDLADWISTYRSRYFMYNGGMNIYNQEIDRYFVYEDDGPSTLVGELELPETRDLPYIGETGSEKRNLTSKQKQAARERFAQDFLLYKQITGG